MSYPGTYLKNEHFAERYKVVAKYLGDCSDKVIVDLNCGEPGLCKYLTYKEYYANDVWEPENKNGIIFTRCTDEEVDIKADILCIFGYGGGEFTGQELESKTAGKSLLRLAEYKPEYIVLEMARKWENDFKIMSSLKEKLTNYDMVYETKLDIFPNEHYHDRRIINILRLKQDAI